MAEAQDFAEWVQEQRTVAAEALAIQAMTKHRAHVLGLVVEEIERLRRSAVRHTEQSQFDEMIRQMKPLPLAGPGPALSSGALGAFMELLRSPFSLGDKTTVTWGEATIEQHQQRIEMLTGMARGIESTIRRHEEAVALLKETGAECLDALAKVPA